MYTDDKCKNELDKIKQKLEQEKISVGIYCIALPSNDKNILDIININELLFKHYKKSKIYILGLAFGRDSAINLVQDIIMEVYKNTGNFDMKHVFLS